MKALKDKYVSDHLWYMALAYLNQVNFQWAYDRHLERYDKTLPKHQRRPMFRLEWLTYEQFLELIHDATQFLIDQSRDITEETIDMYGNG